MMSLTKIHNPNQKIIFRGKLQDLLSLKPLNSSLLLSVPELRSHKTTCDPFFGAKIPEQYWAPKC